MSLNDDSVKIEVLRLHNEGLSLRKIADVVGISHSTIGKFLNKESYQQWWLDNDKPIAAGALNDHHVNIRRMEGKRFILTSAQNNTFVHREFLASLETMAEHLDAQIIVGTFSYNTSGFQNLGKGEADWFDPKIEPYIVDEPVQLADGLLWCGELNILPTAVNPFSGMHSYAKSSSAIIPHTKVQLESVPTHKSQPCRMMYTTGAVTLRNYIQKKAGQKASFHHIFGALIVEVDDDGDWFVRQLIAESDNGHFQDLDCKYTPTGVDASCDVEAINWGDLHSEKADPEVYRASFGQEAGRVSLIDRLKPRFQFVHDVLDFESRNHHTIKDPYFRFKMHVEGRDSVKDNIADVVRTLMYLNRPFCRTVVVESNHDLALRRWLKEADYKTDPTNAVFFLECQLAQYRAIERGDSGFSIFEWAVKDHAPCLNGVRFLKTDESFMICGKDGIECGQHSHLGANGSRGSVAVYQKLGTRYNIGHSHSAAIKDGVYQAGVSAKLDMGYNVGANSWSHSHIITYPNGKRAIVTLKNGKYCA